MPSDIWVSRDYLGMQVLRSQAVLDLLARVPHPGPRLVVDLGCGPGNNTALIARHWPDALVVGVDNSPNMIAAASKLEQPGHLEFRLGDLATWQPDEAADVVLLNAVLQWLPGHPALVPGLAAMLAPGGVLGFQMPGTAGAGSSLHEIAREVACGPRWRDTLGTAYRDLDLLSPLGYITVLGDAGLRAQAWQTEYTYLLPGEGSLVEYASGSILRPALALLAQEEAAQFLADYGQRLHEARPPRVIGGERAEVLSQSRVFAVGWRAPAAG
jgi:trans-aconitate 2-methyltransferase